MPGYFSVERDFLESDFWLSEPFTKPQAWVDLFGVANHSPGYFVKRGIQIPIERSQTGRSELTLAKRWKWSRNKVRRFLKWLEKEKMIMLKQDNKTSIITICNYNAYQRIKNECDTPKGTPKGTPNDTPERHQKDTKRNTNNNVNNIKNVKKKNSFAPEPENFEISEKLLKWANSKEISIEALKIHVEMCLNHFQDGKTKRPEWSRSIMNWATSDLAGINKKHPIKVKYDYL
ncbi:MAG: hypothetical protein GWP06_02815 [Actinobacteria bacterium]|nr:hypothetical protein [Actinomycetota bacterium]